MRGCSVEAKGEDPHSAKPLEMILPESELYYHCLAIKVAAAIHQPMGETTTPEAKVESVSETDLPLEPTPQSEPAEKEEHQSELPEAAARPVAHYPD